MTCRSKPEIRTVVYVLGDVGYQSNGSNLTARTRKREVEEKDDLLGDQERGTNVAWSDWITVDRYCLRRLKSMMGSTGLCQTPSYQALPGPNRANIVRSYKSMLFIHLLH